LGEHTGAAIGVGLGDASMGNAGVGDAGTTVMVTAMRARAGAAAMAAGKSGSLLASPLLLAWSLAVLPMRGEEGDGRYKGEGIGTGWWLQPVLKTL
jgi:hypothetical protein